MLHRRVLSVDRVRLRCMLIAGVFVAFCSASVAAADEFTEFARVSMRLKFLQQTWHRDLVEQDAVHSQVMDAQVTGQQTTSVAVRLTSAPGSQMAELHLHSHGRVQSSTIGTTREARVNSLGDHSFQLTKPVFFDGCRFLTRRAHGQISASTRPIAVSTVVSGIPLLGAFGERIAWSETYRRQPLTNSIVVRQVADDVFPQFDRKVEAELATANRSWAEMRQNFARLLPKHNVDWKAGSTSDGLVLRVGLRGSQSTHTAARPLLHTTMRPDPLPREDLVVSLSDGMVNELLDTLPMDGMTITDATLQGLEEIGVEDVMADGKFRITPELQEVLSAPAMLFSLQFAEETPLEVGFEHGHVAVVLRFRIVPKIGQSSDLHRLELRIKGADGGHGQWAARIDDVEVTTENPDAAPSTLTDIIRKQTRAMLVDQPPALIPRLARLQAETGLPDLQLRDIRSRDGVLRASFQLQQTTPQSIGR